MKTIATTSLLLLATATISAGFSPPIQLPASGSKTTTSLPATRRGFFEVMTAAAIFAVPTMASAEPRPTYLVEPTDEFKENEAKAAAFKRQQLLAKKDFAAALEKLVGEENDADALVADIKALQGLVAKTGGLPLGIKKEELFKTIRSKKAKGFWPTPVEVA